MSRDYAAEMRAVIDSETAGGDPAPLVAARIVEKLDAVDPDLLGGWLHLGAVGFIRDTIGYVHRSGRAHARATGSRSVFAEDAAAGDVSSWLSTRYVVEDGRRPTLAEMTAADLRYVAGQYDQDAREAKTEAAFMRALAKRVGAGRVSDHFTDEQITALRDSLRPSG